MPAADSFRRNPACIKGILVWLSGSIAQSVGAAAALAWQVAKGNLGARVDVSGSDETGRLLEAIRAMVRNSKSLIGHVKQSSLQLTAIAARIESASKNQEKTAIDFGASTAEIAAATRQISSTAQALAGTMGKRHR